MNGRTAGKPILGSSCGEVKKCLPVKSNGANVEDTGNGNVRAKTNQVDSNAPEDTDPYSIQRNAGESVDLGPNVGER